MLSDFDVILFWNYWSLRCNLEVRIPKQTFFLRTFIFRIRTFWSDKKSEIFFPDSGLRKIRTFFVRIQKIGNFDILWEKNRCSSMYLRSKSITNLTKTYHVNLNFSSGRLRRHFTDEKCRKCWVLYQNTTLIKIWAFFFGHLFSEKNVRIWKSIR